MFMIDAVTLVIPILNESASLPELLAAIKAQTRRPSELIFSDAGSTDGSPSLIEEWWEKEGWPEGRCQVLLLPGALPGAGRNAGVRAASSKWIAFLDGGLAPAPNWLACLCHYSEAHQTSAVFGLCRFTAETAFCRAVCALSYGQGTVHPVIPASLFNRDVFVEIGYFPEHLRAAEDIVWVRMLTEQFGEKEVCTDALVHYTHFPTGWSSAFQKWRITEYFCVLAGARLSQQMLYLLVLPLLYVALFAGAKAGFIAMVGYLVIRGIIDPIRRSKEFPWWGNKSSALLIAPALAITLDLAKCIGIIQGLWRKLFGLFFTK